MGRVQQEHNFDTSNVEEYDDEETGMHLGGYGMFQWNGGRTARFLEWAKENGRNPQDPYAQANFAIIEADERGLTPERMNGLSARGAATLWTDEWEVGEHGNEHEYADEWERRIKSGDFGTGNAAMPFHPAFDLSTADDAATAGYLEWAKDAAATEGTPDEIGERRNVFEGLFKTAQERPLTPEERKQAVENFTPEDLQKYGDYLGRQAQPMAQPVAQASRPAQPQAAQDISINTPNLKRAKETQTQTQPQNFIPSTPSEQTQTAQQGMPGLAQVQPLHGQAALTGPQSAGQGVRRQVEAQNAARQEGMQQAQAIQQQNAIAQLSPAAQVVMRQMPSEDNRRRLGFGMLMDADRMDIALPDGLPQALRQGNPEAIATAAQIFRGGMQNANQLQAQSPAPVQRTEAGGYPNQDAEPQQSQPAGAAPTENQVSVLDTSIPGFPASMTYRKHAEIAARNGGSLTQENGQNFISANEGTDYYVNIPVPQEAADYFRQITGQNAPAKGREQSAQNQTAQEAAQPTNGEPRKETIAPKEKTAQNAPNDARGANKENVASKATNEGREKSAQTQIDNSGENKDNSRGRDIVAETKETLRSLRGVPITNKKSGIIATIAKKGASEMMSNKAIDRSSKNGYSREQHLEAVKNIKRLYEEATLQTTDPDKNGDPNIASIKRFTSRTLIHGEEAVARITVKESVEHGHRLYFLELQQLEKPTELTKRTDNASSVGLEGSTQLDQQASTIGAEEPSSSASNIPQTQQQNNRTESRSETTTEGGNKSASTQIDNSGENKDNSRGSDAMDTDTIKARIQAMPDDEIPRRSVENSDRFENLGEQKLFEKAVQEVERLASKNIVDPLGDKVHFAPGKTETMQEYVLHLAAWQNKPLSDIRAKRVLGIALAKDTIEKPLAIVRQDNGRKAYLSLYTDGKDFTNNIIVGVEEGQNGRVVTSMLTADKKGDKRAAVREFKKRISSSKEILYIWEGLSGHPRPSSEQRASTLDAKLHPSGKSNIPQNQEKGNRTESREQADASRSNQGGFSDGENRQGRKPKEPVIERIINKAFPKSGKRGDAAKNFVANYAAALDADNWMKGLSLVEQDYTQQRDAILKDALEALKRGMGKGVDITKDPDTGRSIRTSNNEPWYRSWYKEYGRKPNKAELEQLAEAMVTGESFAHDVEGWQVVSAEDAAARQKTKDRLAEIDRYLDVCNDSRFKDKLKKAEKQWKAEARKGTFYQRVSRAVADFFQSAWQMNGEDAKGSYNIAERLMRLFQSADVSTPIHESAHWYMGEQEEIVNILRETNPDHQIVKDFDKLNQWAEWKPGMINAYRNTPVWDEFKALHDKIEALENKENRTQAEEAELRRLKRQWRFERAARGFEVYMQSGKAPTSGLRHIFEQFRNWLFKIYNDLTQSGMKASPEVEKIFDRWIANSKEIQAQMGRSLNPEERAAYDSLFDTLQKAGYEEEEANAIATIMARMAARLSEAYKEAGQEKSALDLLPRIVRDNEGLANNRDESLAGNPEAAAKFFSKRAEESNALARVHDGMQLEDIRERLLHEENTMVYNAVDDYETLLADKRASQAMKDNAYGNLLKLVEEIDEKRRAFNNGEVIESLAGILRGKIRIGEGSNLEKDLSGDYLRKAGDLQKKTPGAQLIPGEYKRIEEKTKARKDLFARMRQEIRERSIRDALSNSGDELFLQDPEKNLVAYHNISEENLMRAADLGGLPVPSIAVTKRDVPFDKFGDITLIGNREMIDPKNKGNEVYSRDAWTTRFPDIVYDKPKSKDIKAFWAKVKDSFARFGDDGRREISEIDYRISSGESRDRIASSLQSSLGMMYKYLTEIKGEKIDIPQSFNRYDIRKQLREKIDEKKFNAYLNHLLDDVYRNPQIMDGRKKKPITLENVVSAMLKKRGASKEDSLTFGNGKILASISDRYKSLADIRKAKSNLTDSEKAAVSADVFAEKADAYRSLAAKHYNGDTWDAMDDAGRALVAAAKNGGTRSAIEASLRRHGFGEVTPEMLDAAVETLKAAKDVKTDYFEAKPLRAVGFNEFSAAVVSKGTKKETIDFLKSQGLTVKEYDAEKQGDRQRAVEEVQSEKPDVLFQFAGKKAKTADISKMKEAQRMKESGASTREIWNATGWVQGKDGEWRFEISDNLNDIDLKRLELLEETKLSSIYKNPALYKAYPFLKNVTIRIEKMGKRDWGYASKEDNEIVLNSKKLSSDDAKESKKMVVHEIQHMIQFHEGFAVGGDEDYVREDFKKLLDKDKRLKRRSKKWLYKHIAGEMEARATEARAERYTNRQEEIAQAKEDAAEAKETFEEVKRESTPEQLAAMRKRQALQRAILKAYETEGDISDEMEMRREELEEQMGDDLADAYDDMLFAQEEYEAIKEGKGKMPTPRPHFHDALVSFGGMDMPYSAKTEDANAEKTDDTFYQRASAPRQAIKKGMDEANKREADNLDRAAKSAMEKLDAKAAKAAERDAKKKEKLDAWKKEQREKDIAEGRIVQKGNVEIRRGDDNGQLGLFNWLINSPSRLAEKFKAFKPFFVLADKAMKKLTRLRETWSKDLSDALAVAGNKESRGTLYQILLDGDAEGKNYTDAELKEKGASEEIIKAYQSVRKLLDDVIYPAVDDARRRAKVYTKEKTRAEAAKENLTTCRNDLATLKAESQAAKASLQTANDELRKASESFKQYEKERDRVGNRLRNQRNIWEALFFIAAGVAVAR